jgi:hypothetical protein
MLVSLIGLVTIVLVAIVIGALKFERSMWSSDWRLIFPGYREAAAMKGIADKLKVYSDGQDESYADLFRLKLARDSVYATLYQRVYDVGGLEAQVRHLERDLEVSKTNYQDLRKIYRDADAELRRRATEIRRLKGIPVRKRISKLKAAAKSYRTQRGL